MLKSYFEEEKKIEKKVRENEENSDHSIQIFFIDDEGKEEEKNIDLDCFFYDTIDKENLKIFYQETIDFYSKNNKNKYKVITKQTFPKGRRNYFEEIQKEKNKLIQKVLEDWAESCDINKEKFLAFLVAEDFIERHTYGYNLSEFLSTYFKVKEGKNIKNLSELKPKNKLLKFVFEHLKN